jgi:glycosyltransferase involved in cell wall biosynthesis
MTPDTLAEANRGTTFKDNPPLITAVVATFNEQTHIKQCLDGLLRQRGFEGGLEIIVVDGGSQDATLEIIRNMPQARERIRVLNNPRRLQVYAWNIGWKAARGAYVGLISAHTEYDQDYFARCLEVLHRTGAANVGSVQEAIGDGALGRAIAWAMSSPFGIGNAEFRYVKEEKEVDSVFGGFFTKETLAAIGGYDERNPFDEDSDINYRLRKAGKKVVVSPAIKVRYHARSSLRKLVHQMYRYGYWRRRTQMEHPTSTPARIMAPPMLLLGLAVSAALLVTGYNWAVAFPLIYVAFSLSAAVFAFRTLHAASALSLVPIVLTVMHLAYGFGWWVGLYAHRRTVRS